MYLVKSCFKEDNILSRKTIKIGSLHEYRNIENEEIVDKDEGFIQLHINLSNIFLPTDVLSALSYSYNSDNEFDIKNLSTLNYSDILENCIRVSKYDAKATLSKHNRFVFCVSSLHEPSECKTIFTKYNDFWHLNIENAGFFGQAIADSLATTVVNRLKEGESLFTEKFKLDKLVMKWTGEHITYTPRQIHVGNEMVLTKTDQVLRALSHSYMLKPDSFSHEKEFRYVIDFYHDDKLLIPIDKSIIIPATSAISYILQK